MIALTSVFLCLAVLVLAEPIPRNSFVLESRESAPDDFVQKGAPTADTTLELRIALAQNDIATLEQELYAVSTPDSARYGQHLSKEQVEEYVKPSSDTVNIVNEWLSGNGIIPKTISAAGDWLQISVSVDKANELLDTEFNTFIHQESGQETVRTLSYSIPSNLKGHIDLIHPTIAFPVTAFGPPGTKTPSNKFTVRTAGRPTSDVVPPSCASVITPACLQAFYSIPATPATQTSNTLAVSGFIEQYANEADLMQFLQLLRPDLPPTNTFTLQTIDGGTNPQILSEAGIEADLDTQYTIGIASDVPVYFISVGPDNTDGIDGFLDLANFLLAETNLPHVLTTSYGFNENEVPFLLANRLCTAYLTLGTRGMSVFFSSGDGGVSGSQPEACTNFVPTFPSTCPYVTSVGSTTGIPETAANFSSGGFSNYFLIPAYQALSVTAYLLELGTRDAGRFNRTGRGFPDVSAQGENFEVVWRGSPVLVSGTSASSPVWASIIALLDDELVAAGRPPLGFLNPFLYTTGIPALNDITTGDNPGCGTTGFPALPGWDPVTGLGTPNFTRLRTAIGL